MASRSRSGGKASGAQLARRTRDQLSEITGYPAEGVTSLERAEDGSWFVTVELLELERVPATDDVLGSYEAQVDGDGELIGYRRLRRYPRSAAQEQGGGG